MGNVLVVTILILIIGAAVYGTGGGSCASCMPEGGFRNMGVMWEVVDT